MSYLKITNISIQAEGAERLVKAADELRGTGIETEIVSADYRELERDAVRFDDILHDIADSDLVLIRCMAEPDRFKRYDVLEGKLKDCKGYVLIFSGSLDMQPVYRSAFRGSDSDYSLLCGYLTYKGEENEKGIILWLNSKTGGPDMPVPDVTMPRQDGIYHPDCPRDVSFEEYLRRLDPDKPTAGVVMTQTDWLLDNTRHIDALIREIESTGMNVIPVFYSHLAPPMNGESGLPVYIRKYMMDGGRPRIDVLVLTVSNSHLLRSKKKDVVPFNEELASNFYKYLADVPVIQALSIHNKWEDYEEDASGLDKHDITILVIRPELDAHILGVPFGCMVEGSGKRLTAIPAGVDHIARMAWNWAALRRKPPSERRIALIMYQPRDDSSCIGSSGSLDVQGSVVSILKRMSEAGYKVDHIPQDGDDLIQEVLKGVTNDLNWMSKNDIMEKAAGVQDKNDYRKVFDSVPKFNQDRLIRHWGDPPGKITVIGDKMVMPGVLNGNILITYQPIRAWGEQTDALYHDPVIPAPHQYLGFYRWLKNGFKADAIVHMGTHGSLEWLPGKSVGLSNKCEPDMIMDALPDVYPFCIDDPGEGIQAKRRAEAVLIAYLNPSMARAGSYQDIEKMDSLLREYFTLKGSLSGERKDVLVTELYNEAKGLDIFEDLKIPEDVKASDFEQYVLPLHEYVSEVKDALIPDGLHILGKVPAERHLDECIYSISRIRNGETPSLRSAFASMLGIDLEDCLDNPSEKLPSGELKSMAVDRLDGELMKLIETSRSFGFNRDETFEYCRNAFSVNDQFSESLGFALDVTIPNILRTDLEMEHFMHAIDGGYVPPGPSGPPTRGNARILPSGRNFYGIDPDSVPTVTAWEIGKRMADQMLQRFLEEKGHYPHQIGIVIWATDTMKTNGDDVGYILWLMGVKPVWSKSGDLIQGLEVIPVKELGRPRIDVTIRITGLFRDAYPNLVDLFNDAMDLVADLDEDDDENYIACNVRKEVTEMIISGLPPDEARESAMIRVFGSPPGSYGGGVNLAIATGAWKSTEDLAECAVVWSSYAYGRGQYGVRKEKEFRRRFSKVEANIKNMPDREHDILAMDDVFEYMGGLNAFSRAYGVKDAMFFTGDDSDPDKSRIRTIEEECQFIFRSKVLNPKWLEGIKEHGYRGAQELSKLAEYMIGWDGTTGSIDDWMYKRFTEKFIFDEDTREWMKEKNPFALNEMMMRMFEAIDRGLWDADENTVKMLKQIYLENEERIEIVTDNDNRRYMRCPINYI